MPAGSGAVPAVGLLLGQGAQRCAPSALRVSQAGAGALGLRCSLRLFFSLVKLTIWLSVQYSQFGTIPHLPEPFLAGVKNQEQF